MVTAPGLPLPKTPEQLRDELEKLRANPPPDYAYRTARLLKELERLDNARRPYALT